MPTPRVTISKMQHTLRLLHSGQLSLCQIGAALGISNSRVSEIASYTLAIGQDWALVPLLSDQALQARGLACALKTLIFNNEKS